MSENVNWHSCRRYSAQSDLFFWDEYYVQKDWKENISSVHSKQPFVACVASRCVFDLNKRQSKVVMSLEVNQCLTRVETILASAFQHQIEQALTRFLCRFHNFSGCQTITGRRTTRSICCQWDVGCERSWLPIRQWPISNVLLPVETEGMVS